MVTPTARPAPVITPTALPTALRTRAPRATPVVTQGEIDVLAARMRLPIAGLGAAAIHHTFSEMRGTHRHEATDIVAIRGTPVLAVDDGVVAKLFTSVPGGLTVYQFSADGVWSFYYAHLDHYREGLCEGAELHAGDVIGYVGTTGNAGLTPHLHFAIFRLGPDHLWWDGTPIDPYPLLRTAVAR